MENLKQIVEKRPKCPFYGFYGGPGILIDQKGNQCPLISGYSPCLMEVKDKSPNWKDCYFSKNKSLDDFASFKVHVLNIENLISFTEWSESILGD